MKHLNYEDRLDIQRLLNEGNSFSKIGISIGKSHTTISREVHMHRYAFGQVKCNDCKNRHSCKKSIDCSNANCRKLKCDVVCSGCIQGCKKYVKEQCDRLSKPPYVCNGCVNKASCIKTKFRYEAKQAQIDYHRKLSTSREGVYITPEEIHFLEEEIVPLIKNGISVNVACSKNADKMPVSSRTMYKYIDKGIFDINNLDLRLKARQKPRKKSGPVLRVDRKCHIGRTYEEFEKYVNQNPDATVCEMDTVEGKRGGKVVLTLFFRNCDLQLMYIRETNTAATVSAIFKKLRRDLGDDFSKLFQVILTDRGSEFTNPTSIEVNPDTGEIECRLFYCDPMNTNQKSRCERNHELIRYIIPKGNPMDNYTQNDINIVMNNVNSMPRPKFNAENPIQIFKKIYGEELLKKLGLQELELKKICLRPEAIKK